MIQMNLCTKLKHTDIENKLMLTKGYSGSSGGCAGDTLGVGD